MYCWPWQYVSMLSRMSIACASLALRSGVHVSSSCLHASGHIARKSARRTCTWILQLRGHSLEVVVRGHDCAMCSSALLQPLLRRALVARVRSRVSSVVGSGRGKVHWCVAGVEMWCRGALVALSRKLGSGKESAGYFAWRCIKIISGRKECVELLSCCRSRPT